MIGHSIRSDECCSSLFTGHAISFNRDTDKHEGRSEVDEWRVAAGWECDGLWRVGMFEQVSLETRQELTAGDGKERGRIVGVGSEWMDWYAELRWEGFP